MRRFGANCQFWNGEWVLLQVGAKLFGRRCGNIALGELTRKDGDVCPDVFRDNAGPCPPRSSVVVESAWFVRPRSRLSPVTAYVV